MLGTSKGKEEGFQYEKKKGKERKKH